MDNKGPESKSDQEKTDMESLSSHHTFCHNQLSKASALISNELTACRDDKPALPAATAPLNHTPWSQGSQCPLTVTVAPPNTHGGASFIGPEPPPTGPDPGSRTFPQSNFKSRGSCQMSLSLLQRKDSLF